MELVSGSVLWELFHPSCFASPLPQTILSWHLIFLSLWCALWEHCSLDILHHHLCSPYLLLLLSSLQAVLTRSRHADDFDLKKTQPSSPFLLFMAEGMSKWGNSMSSTLFQTASLQLQGCLKKSVSRWLPQQLQRRIWLHLSFEASFLQGTVARRHMQFLPPWAWSCCREVLLQVYTCLSQDIAKMVSHETQFSANIQQVSTLEEGIFSLFNYQLMLKFCAFSHSSYQKLFESSIFYTAQWPSLDIIVYCMCF